MAKRLEAPMKSVATDIQVLRKVRDGWYVYTCQQLPGLYVASTDDRAAYEDVPLSIETLFKAAHDIKVRVANKLPYDDFMAMIAIRDRAKDAVKTRTRELMNENQSVFNFVVESAGGDHFSA